jgi:DNA polymerase III sliding clamp (beta) subunit (PCNA family)
MQFVFKTAETLELLIGMFKFRPKNPAVVDLNNFCFEVNNNQMFVKIYDLQTMVKVQMPVQIFNCTEPVCFMINAQEVIDFLKSFSSNNYPEFSLDVDMDKETCFLSIPKFKQQLPCYNGEEYPKLTGLPATATSFSISNIELYNIIDKGLEVVADDVVVVVVAVPGKEVVVGGKGLSKTAEHLRHKQKLQQEKKNEKKRENNTIKHHSLLFICVAYKI